MTKSNTKKLHTHTRPKQTRQSLPIRTRTLRASRPKVPPSRNDGRIPGEKRADASKRRKKAMRFAIELVASMALAREKPSRPCTRRRPAETARLGSLERLTRFGRISRIQTTTLRCRSKCRRSRGWRRRC